MHGHDRDVRLDRRERIVGRLGRDAGQRGEQRGLAGVRHPDDPDLHRHRPPPCAGRRAPACDRACARSAAAGGRAGRTRPVTLVSPCRLTRDDARMPPRVLDRVPPSPTLAADQRMRERIAAGRPVIHLAFGEAGLPVPDAVRDVLARASVHNAYGSVAGSGGTSGGRRLLRPPRDSDDPRADRARAGLQAAAVGADLDARRGRDPAAAVVGQLRRPGAPRRPPGVARRDPGGRGRGAGTGGAGPHARMGRARRWRPGRAGLDPARQSDRHARPGAGRAGGRRDRSAPRPGHHLRRDLSRPRVCAGGVPEPGAARSRARPSSPTG